MTAGATADIPGALNTLPGTTTNGETGRLFVRGGTANETQAFIDGVLVHNFYTASPNNVPSRSRFSPFLFKGTFFSTGGYSAEYGQALSSVLSLNSMDLPDETRTDFSVMTVGLDAAHTQKWENGSIYGQVQYTDLNPYNNLIDQTYDWEDGFSSANGTFMLRQKITGDDMLKVYANFDHADFIVNMPNINYPEKDHIENNNNNSYINTSYRKAIGSNSTGYLGLSYGQTADDTKYNDTRYSKSPKELSWQGDTLRATSIICLLKLVEKSLLLTLQKMSQSQMMAPTNEDMITTWSQGLSNRIIMQPTVWQYVPDCDMHTTQFSKNQHYRQDYPWH